MDVGDNLDTLAAEALDLFTALPAAFLVAVASFWGDTAPPPELAAIAAAIRRAVEAVGGSYLGITDPLRDHPERNGRRAGSQQPGPCGDRRRLGPKLRSLLGAATSGSTTTPTGSASASASASASG